MLVSSPGGDATQELGVPSPEGEASQDLGGRRNPRKKLHISSLFDKREVTSQPDLTNSSEVIGRKDDGL